jgi:hypothetical protein
VGKWWLLIIIAVVFAAVYKRLGQRIGSGAARRRFSRFIPMLFLGALLVYTGQRGNLLSKSIMHFVRDELPIGLAALEWFALLVWPIRKQQYGEVLQDLGPHPARRAMLLMALSGALGGVASLVGNIEESGFHWSALGTEAFLFSSAIAGLVVARSRVYATQRGIVRFEHQFDWDSIESWTFERGGTVDLLKLRVRTWVPWGRRPTIDVPVEHRPVLEQLLRDHAAPSTSGTPQQALRAE